MHPPLSGWTPVRTTVSVHIPTLDGAAIARTIPVKVDAWESVDGEIYLTGEAEEQLDALKALHMGLSRPPVRK